MCQKTEIVSCCMFIFLNRFVYRCGLLVLHRINGVEFTIPALQKV